MLQRSLYKLSPHYFSMHPQFAIDLITIPFTLGTGLIILYFLPFTVLEATFILFGPILIREFGVVSRCYVLGAFFVMLGCVLIRRKHTNAGLIAFLIGAFSHLLFTWVSFSLTIAFLVQTHRSKSFIKPIVIFLLYIFAVMIQIAPKDTSLPSTSLVNLETLWVTIKSFNQMLWGIERVWKDYQWNTRPLANDLPAALLIPALYMIKQRTSLVNALFISLPPVALVATAYAVNTRYLGVAYFGLLACFVLFERKHAKPRSRLLDPILMFSATALISTVGWVVMWKPWSKHEFEFSGTRELISKNLIDPVNDILVTEPDDIYLTWMAETNSQVFNSQRNKWLRYPHYKKSEYLYKDLDTWCAAELTNLRDKYRSRRIFFGVKKGRLPPQKCGHLKLAYSTDIRTATDETFDIYIESH